jgi:hypothetical protein
MKTILVVLVLASCVLPSRFSGQGPFCWAGTDERGKDRYISCKQPRTRLPTIDVDLSTFNGLIVTVDDRSVRVSREQFLTALAAWTAEVNSSRPLSPH